MREEPRRPGPVVALFALASITILTLDASHGDGGSPIDPLRSAVGSVMGPTERASADLFRPVSRIPDHFAKVDDLQRDKATLQAANDRLAEQLRTAELNTSRLGELQGIDALTKEKGLDVVRAQVIAMGPAQSFSRTVTIDTGTNDGVVPDLTVINANGLVGRVIEANRSTATVLLIVDAKSTVGGRLGDSMELGFLEGDGDVSGDASLELSLVDHTVSPRVGDSVMTWGSHNQAPYVAGVPIGSVTGVRSSPAELTQTAAIRPYVDFSSLDVVAVVTGAQGKAADLAGEGLR